MDEGDRAGRVARCMADLLGGAREFEGLVVGERGFGGAGGDEFAHARGEVLDGVGEPWLLFGVEVDIDSGERGAELVEPGDVVDVGVGEDDRFGFEVCGADGVDHRLGVE